MSTAAQTSPPRDQYIWIPRWREFQHYKPDPERGPKWIKQHTGQLNDARYLDLTDRQRALLHDVRMMFAAFRCRLPCGEPTTHGQRADDSPTLHRRFADGARMIARHRNAQTRDVDLKALNDAGLIEFISRATLEQRLEQLYSGSRAEVEVEKEKNSVLETQTVSSTAVAVIAKRNGTTPAIEPVTAQTLTAEYVDACHDHHIETPRRLIGQIAQATGQLLEEGVDPDRIRAGYRRMINRGIVQPSLLANFVSEASIPTQLRATANGGMTSAEIRDATKGLQ